MIPSTLLGKWEGEEGTSLRNSRNCATVDDEQSTVTSHNGTSWEFARDFTFSRGLFLRIGDCCCCI